MTHFDIPKSKVGYICATDKALSRWGLSEGRYNRFIFPCNSLEDVQAVIENCHSRPEFIRVIHCLTKPKLNNWLNFYQVKTKEDYPNHYKPGYF